MDNDKKDSHLNRETLLKQDLLEYTEAYNTSVDAIDETIIKFSSIALMLSLIALCSLSHDTAHLTFSMLIVIFICFSVALCFTLLSHCCTIKMCNEILSKIRESYKEASLYKATTYSKYNKRLVLANRISLFAFFFGIIACLVFGVLCCA